VKSQITNLKVQMARASSAAVLAAMGISTLLAADDLPDNIMWMSPGPQDVWPQVEGKPKQLKFNVTPALAQMFNEQLQELRADAAAGIGDEPFLDFNHNDEERAAEVTELYWGGDDAKTGGIRARVKWSAAGKAAVLGRNYRRFSPQWGFDKSTGEPLTIYPNLGGLVNRAAFTNIAPVIAKNGAATPTPQNTMTDKEITDAIAAGFKPYGERLTAIEGRLPATTATAAAAAAAAAAPDIGKIVTDALKPVVDRFNKLEADTQKASARAAIQPHINRGAIAPQDNDTIKFWEDSWTANAKGAEAQLARLPSLKTGRLNLGQKNTAAENAAASGAEPDAQIMAAAEEIAAKGNGKMTLADALIATARSPQGQENYMKFRQSFASKN
jgi:hypothetical protein